MLYSRNTDGGAFARYRSRRRICFEKTGLSTEYTPAYYLHGFADGHDSFAQTKFIVKYASEKQTMMTAIKHTDGWRVVPVTSEEYQTFQQAYMREYADVLDVPEGLVFDAWYYCEPSAPIINAPALPGGARSQIGPIGRGFEFAVFDLETGLFIFIDFIDQFG